MSCRINPTGGCFEKTSRSHACSIWTSWAGSQLCLLQEKDLEKIKRLGSSEFLHGKWCVRSFCGCLKKRNPQPRIKANSSLWSNCTQPGSPVPGKGYRSNRRKNQNCPLSLELQQSIIASSLGLTKAQNFQSKQSQCMIENDIGPQRLKKVSNRQSSAKNILQNHGAPNGPYSNLRMASKKSLRFVWICFAFIIKISF